MDYSTACVDWENRLVNGQSIIPPPIYTDQAAEALAIFKSLRVVDLPGKPTFGECSDQFVFDFVAAIFGAYDAESGNQLIREVLFLVAKKNTKSTLAAGIMLTATILCWRDDEEHLILAPTKEVADNSFKPAASMVRADEELTALFHVQDHIRTITHRVSKASLKVVAADTDTVSGKKSGRVLVDELWLFGKKANAESMFMEALGGQVSRNEGWVIYLTTQSDDAPSGVFKDKLNYFRDVRDGKIIDNRSLPVLYEFPSAMVASKAYLDPANFYIVNPNVGRSVSKEWLESELKKNQNKTDGTYQVFLAKHLNVEIGLNLRAGRWAGADFWESCEDESVTFESILERCEVVTIGIDGGGLDDLLGLTVLGREIGTRKRLSWSHAWAHRIVLTRRMDIAPRFNDFFKAGELTMVESPGQDVKEVADIVCKVADAGLLPEKQAIGVDAVGIGDIVDELVTEDRGISMDQVVAISQGWRLNGAIKGTERDLVAGELRCAKSLLMRWCVSNCKVEVKGNAIAITKQASGSAKIDPVMSLFNAQSCMNLNPEAAGKTIYNDRGVYFA